MLNWIIIITQQYLEPFNEANEGIIYDWITSVK